MAQNISVSVLLSSYNGEAFIEEQINSILSQRGVSVSLTVRDDGSTDSTIKILERLASQYENICLLKGNNLGVANSFFALLKNASAVGNSVAQFYALADQDDVWNPDKLLNAVTALQSQPGDNVAMYCSAIEYVDAELNHLQNSDIYSSDKVGFNNALVQNIATGCTIVLNRPAIAKIVVEFPELCVMHDWWIYLVVSAFGKVIYDPNPAMKYRQHGHNVMGISRSAIQRFRRRWARLFSNVKSTKTSLQLIEFNRLYGNELNKKQKELLHSLISYKANMSWRLALIFRNDFQRQSNIDNLLLRLTMLIGRF